ncbi:DNA internalization-related competence protein ComEC/Rec2 [Paenibacillus filicis]|uniref:DNA internalization-related competence protein ComEC/Rec2 n=1 Tax=Paenibacillus gyeongsangnamensis TaxID=3388067 RepID=A0ABT4Q358_9BACL|nr:DNA internalization-related competence protein ComEC/Rec2 [Paenibacillus filicis]MCZ8511135.1 DNA internalization-related competence protein ComEC/Rec2 [Paenibacillus filicis]
MVWDGVQSWLRSRPLVVFALLWIAGYAGACSLELPWLDIRTSLVSGALLGAAALFGSGLWKKPLIALLIIATAAAYYGQYDQGNRSQLAGVVTEEAELAGKISVASPVQVDGDRVSFQAVAESLIVNGAETPARGERLQVSIRLLKREEQALAEAWERGDRLELSGTLRAPEGARNFDGFDYRRYLRLQHIHWQLSIKGLSTVTAEKLGWRDVGFWNPLRHADRLRQQLGDRIERLFPKEQSGFMKGLLIGMAEDFEPAQFDMFSKLGLTHIIAVSGLHVAVFLGCVLWVLRRVGLTKEKTLLICIGLMPLYIIATGALPSIIRAGVMSMIGLYAAYRGKLKDGLHVALGAGVLILFWDPYFMLNVSFQLSYLVTLGLIVGVPRVSRLIPVRQAKLRDALSIALVAQFMSFPLTIYYFNQFSFLSLEANLLMVPAFSAFTMPVGMIALFAGMVWLPAGSVIAWVVAKGNALFFWAIGLMGRWDTFQTIWPSPNGLWIVVYYSLAAILVYSLTVWRKTRDEARSPKAGPNLLTAGEEIVQHRLRTLTIGGLLPLSGLGLCIWLAYGYAPEMGRPQGGQVQFIDVGQGDSILIRSPAAGKVMLIDGGGTVTFRKPGEEWKQRRDPYEVGKKLLVPLLKKRGVQRIDYLLLTHQDADHYGGLQAVLEQVPVDRLLFNGTLKPGAEVEKLFSTALSKGTELIAMRSGDGLVLDQRTKLDFLYPQPQDEAIRLLKDQNPSSVVFYMEMDGTRWLFTGDMDQAAERLVLQQGTGGVVRPIDVMKIAHHGSKSSTSPEWLSAWQPKHAVISVGAHNVYGHPNPGVLERLTNGGTAIHRTDRDGEVQMAVKGGRIFIRSKLKEAS